MSGEDRFDGLFLNVAQQAQGIEPLLDNLFGFLRRKTDFYVGASTEQIEELVLKVIRKHGQIVEKEKVEKKEKAAREEKKRALEKKKKEDAAAAAAALAKAQSPSADDDVIDLSADGVTDISKASSSTSTPKPPTPPDSTTPLPTDDSKPDGEEDKDEDKEDDKTPPPLGNGGTTDKYTWTQTLSEVSISVPLPADTKTKNLSVDIKNTSLKITLKSTPPIVLVDGPLHKRVIVDDSLWTIEDGELALTLQKDNKMEWWSCVIQGDAEIDTKKVQPENSKLGDLDAETRQTVEKMMFDQRQKAAGLPSSEELQKQEMLKKFMASHPEMDFSNAKFN